MNRTFRLLTLLSLTAATPALAEEPLPDAKPLWRKRCAGCHGEDGKGDTAVGRKYKVADLSDVSWPLAWSKPRVKQVIEQGVEGKMPAWKEKLTAAEIDALTAFSFSFAPKPKK